MGKGVAWLVNIGKKLGVIYGMNFDELWDFLRAHQCYTV